ncbi:MAG: thioredoxin-like domain-containing protein [Bacteroidota bacterium]
MKKLPNFKAFIVPTLLLFILSSCKNEFSSDNYVAYFGGEIINPSNRFVLFCKNNEVIDTIPLKKDNTFFKKFDSLTPGLYTFKHEPEYQYIYFDKNDSLMVHINTKDFDESVIFCGRGDEKNNFLMDMYLRNEEDKNKMFDVFDYDVAKFNTTINATYKKNTQYYNSKKEEIKWNEAFDVYAKATLNFPHYTKKEIYPVIHRMRTGNDIYEKLPKDYYDFRKNVDYSNETLTDFSPFAMYLNHMLNNVSAIKYHNHFSEVDIALKTNINKIKIADTLIKNEKVKNMVLNNIAIKYLLEDQNMVNNNLFLDTYHKYSTDKSQKNEIVKIGNAIQLLKPNFDLPKVDFITNDGKTVSSSDLIQQKTVFFFWSSQASSHMVSVHKKVIDFKKRHPDYDFIAININDKIDAWKEVLSNYTFNGIKQYHCANFEDLRAKWAITKIHRTIIVNKDKTIKNAFTNIFDVNFEKELD